ncbi:MAG TPA: phosphomannomutase/phosphoglucomutase [Polyangiaceae bacterium]|nr:phosphomannomutase/phosphoglucomutase [Polyangiaceae bacterium]
MRLPAHAFREYDIRGVADRDLTDDVARGIGRGFGTMIGAGANGGRVRVAVGRDCRVSSERLFAALVDGLLAAGAHVVDVGVGPTPMLYASVHALGTEGGVMITGSHNPGDENGFKMMRGKASFFGGDIQSLRKVIEEERYSRAVPSLAGEAQRGSVERVDMQARYVEMVTSGIHLERNDLRFVLDAGNGAGGPLGVAAMRKLGLAPDCLYCEMDGRFPNHHPDPTVPKNLDALVARVKATGARVGLAYDGDADRLGAVDADGDIVWGDRLMILFSRALLADKPGAAILGEVKCSQTLYDDIAKHGGRPILWKTGHSLIKTKMKEEGALLAGEMSGHLFFADRYFGYDDAIYASLRLLEILARDPRSIAEMLADVPRTYATPEIRVDCPDAVKFDVVAAVRSHYRGLGLPVVDIDGARISFGSERDPAWGLVRASNTGPVLVMRFEATTPERRDAIHAEVEGVVTAARARLGAA